MDADLAAVQRRTLRVLASAQVLGGVGVGAAISVGGLIAEDVSGSTTLSGLSQTASVLGAAVIALPMARVMAARGRRPGLAGGYIVALTGALLVVGGAVAGTFLVVLLGAALLGGGTATNLQSRYAAADLAGPANRARALATVVWATTVGVVLGPNLTGPGGSAARAVGLPALTGPVLFSVAAFAASAAVIHLGLRPDPLLTARAAAATAGEPPAGEVSRSQVLAALTATPRALLAVVGMATAHTVMVVVMVMTPVHMRHHGSSLEVVGLVISVHVAGMYALSPVVGWLADRLGRVPVLVLGQLVLLVAVAVAGLSGPDVVLGVGLFLLGLGWSCALVAGSTLLSESVGDDVRPRVQGVADFTMGMAGAAGGAASGLVLGLSGFGTLNALAGLLVVPVLVLAARQRRVGRPVEHTFG